MECTLLYDSTLTGPSRIGNRMMCIQHYASTSKESLRYKNQMACIRFDVDKTVA